eukprot:5557749-Pyramimonas_sp.AAC.1
MRSLTYLRIWGASVLSSHLQIRGPRVDLPPGCVAERATQEKREIYAEMSPPFHFIVVVYESHL